MPIVSVVALAEKAKAADPGDVGAVELALSDSRAAEARGFAEASATRSDPPRQLTPQLVDIARRLPDGPVEVTLSPEELGRVRLSMTGADGVMTVQIAADRPETLDLLRRHIEVLASDLRDQGYTELTFAFSGGDSGSGYSDDAPAGAPSAAIQSNGDSGGAPVGPAAGLSATSGLDLRL